VELTVALPPRVLVSEDAIVWTPATSLCHKLVTVARRSQVYDKPRHVGYPTIRAGARPGRESHASTALSYAYGLASGSAGSTGTSAGVAVVGDGH